MNQSNIWNPDEVDEYGRIKSQQNDSYNSQSQRDKHETFFCCVQACCYILCFHGVEMAEIQASNIREKWERVITSRAVPLRFCLTSVRQEFIRLAIHTNLLSEQAWSLVPADIKNTNQDVSKDSNISSGIKIKVKVPGRNFISSMTTDSHKGSNENPLDSFFPFDPCLLRMLHESIIDSYRTWYGIPGIDTDNNDINDYSHGLEQYSDFDIDDSNYDETMSMSDTEIYSISSGSSTTSNAFLNNSEAHPKIFQKSYVGGSDSVFGSYFNGSNNEGENIKEDDDNEDDGGVLSMANNNWALPVRRPRQFSIGSTGSW